MSYGVTGQSHPLRLQRRPTQHWRAMTVSPMNDDADEPARESAKPGMTKDLPSVEPPSAGFIVQLFVIPAIIVMVVLGVWLLFGQLATGEFDWRRAVANIKSENPHIRWRAAMTLSEMLDADAARGEDGQHLAENVEIADSICDIYAGLIAQTQFTDEEREQMEFLSKAMGRLDVPEVVTPVLLSAMRHDDEDIQRQSLVAASMIAGESQERGRPLDDAEVVDAAVDLSYSETSIIRQSAVYLLGLLESDDAGPRLTALLNHGDPTTRINAAIGLARSGSLAGMAVFEEAVEGAISEPPVNPGRTATAEEQQAYLHELLILTNTIKALDLLKASLSETDRTAWADRLGRLADVCDNDVVRLQALQSREEL